MMAAEKEGAKGQNHKKETWVFFLSSRDKQILYIQEKGILCDFTIHNGSKRMTFGTVIDGDNRKKSYLYTT